MNKVDVVIISIPEFDSPLIRDFIHRYHTCFNKIYYVFNYVFASPLTVKERSFIEFIENDLKDKCEILHQATELHGVHDWRSLSMNAALVKSNADYIFSIEPDFVGDWDKIVDKMLNVEYSLFTNYSAATDISTFRFWPSFWGCKRSLLNKVDCNFSSMSDDRVKSLCGIKYDKVIKYSPPFSVATDLYTNGTCNLTNKIVKVETDVENAYYDHFDYVSTQLMDLVQDDGKQLLFLNRMPDVWYEHMSGITYDFREVSNGKSMPRTNNAYRRFYELCLLCTVTFFNEWRQVSKVIVNTV